LKKTAWFLVLAYLAIFMLLTWPVIAAAFIYDGMPAEEIFAVFCDGQYWILIGALLLSEAGMLLLPVKIEMRRPVARRHVLLPITVAAFLAAALFVGVVFSVGDFIQREAVFHSRWERWISLVGAGFIWVVWGFVFYRISKRRDPKSLVLLQCRRQRYHPAGRGSDPYYRPLPGLLLRRSRHLHRHHLWNCGNADLVRPRHLFPLCGKIAQAASFVASGNRY